MGCLILNRRFTAYFVAFCLCTGSCTTAATLRDLFETVGLTSETLGVHEPAVDYDTSSSAMQKVIQSGVYAHYLAQTDREDKAGADFRTLLESEDVFNKTQILRNLARVAYGKQDLEKALEFAQRAYNLETTETETLILLGQVFLAKAQNSEKSILFKSGKEDFLNEALNYLDQANREETSNTLVLEALARVYLSQQNIEKVTDCYKQIVEIAPRDMERQNILINILLSTENYADAVVQLEKLAQTRRGFPAIYEMQSTCYFELKQYDEALDRAKQGLLLDARNRKLVTAFDKAATELSKKGNASVISKYKQFADEYPHSMSIQKLYALKLEDTKAPEAEISAQWMSVLKAEPESHETLLHLALRLAKQGKVAEATEYSMKALDIDPTNTEVYELVCTLLDDEGKTSESIELVERGIRLMPGNGELYWLLHKEQFKAGLFTEAYDTLRRGSESSSPSANVLSAFAARLDNDNETTVAHELHRKAMELAPDNAEIFANYYAYLLFNGQILEAGKVASQITRKFQSQTTDSHIILGMAAIKACNLPIAILNFRKSLSGEMKSPIAAVQLVLLLNQMKDNGAAIEFLNSPKANEMLNEETRLRLLAVNYFYNKNIEKAMTTLEKLEQSRKENSFSILQTKLDFYLQSEDFENAQKTLKLMTKEADADGDDIAAMQSTYYSKMKVFEQSKSVLKKQIESAKPDDRMDNLYYMLGSVYFEQKEYDLAMPHLQKAIELNPNNQAALNALAYLYSVLNINIEKAEYYIDKALLFAPEQPAYWDTKGWVLYRKGNFKRSKMWIDAAKGVMGMDDLELNEHSDAVNKALETH